MPYLMAAYRRLTITVPAQVRSALLRAGRHEGVSVSDVVTRGLQKFIEGRLGEIQPSPTGAVWTKVELFLSLELLDSVRARLRQTGYPLSSLLGAIATEADPELPRAWPQPTPTMEVFLRHLAVRGWVIQPIDDGAFTLRERDGREELHLSISEHGTACDALPRLPASVPGPTAIAAVEAVAAPYAVTLIMSWTRQAHFITSVFPSPSQVRTLRQITHELIAVDAPNDDLPLVLPTARAWLPELTDVDPRFRFLREAWTWIAPADQTPETAQRLARTIGQFPADFIATILRQPDLRAELESRVRRVAAQGTWRDLIRHIDGVAGYRPARRRDRR
jgi:hypothetical protein